VTIGADADLGLPVAPTDDVLRRILVPVGDDHAPSEGLTYGANMAGRTGGQLRLVHVRIWDPPVRGSQRWYPESEQEALTVLGRSVSRAWAAGLPASGIVVTAERRQVAAAVAAAAESWHADVIVVAREPRRRLRRMLSSHLSDRLTETSKCPVLIVCAKR
jgi:nucleotide-binding universal stress UspA family protein